MLKIENLKNCTGCTACYSICPKNAIDMVEDEKGFKYPIINKEKCINCGLCKKICPITKNKESSYKSKAYACYNKNEKERKNSSSGGIFILLAKEIIKQGGKVFGAYLNSENRVEHVKIDSIKNLEILMGSKYVQSNMGDVFKEVKKELENDNYVLFTGTPCQIEGLKYFLIKDYDKLYTQDIICHGVPSPRVWEKYKKYREKKDNEIPKRISFRNKDNGWKLFNMKFEYEKKEYKQNQEEDLFMQVFLKDITLRDSCYNCHFKKTNRISDITLADYWGIENIHPEFDDNKGTSVVIINSQKGGKLFEKVKPKIEYCETKMEEVIKYNPALIKSAEKNLFRKKFFNHLDTMDFEKLVNKCTKSYPIHYKIFRKLKRIINKIKKHL